MGVLVDRAAGLDVHKKSITACVMWTQGRTVRKKIARFETITVDCYASRRGSMSMALRMFVWKQPASIGSPPRRHSDEHRMRWQAVRCEGRRGFPILAPAPGRSSHFIVLRSAFISRHHLLHSVCTAGPPSWSVR